MGDSRVLAHQIRAVALESSARCAHDGDDRDVEGGRARGSELISASEPEDVAANKRLGGHHGH
jgi:hypothetical protein